MLLAKFLIETPNADGKIELLEKHEQECTIDRKVLHTKL